MYSHLNRIGFQTTQIVWLIRINLSARNFILLSSKWIETAYWFVWCHSICYNWFILWDEFWWLLNRPGYIKITLESFSSKLISKEMDYVAIYKSTFILWCSIIYPSRSVHIFCFLHPNEVIKNFVISQIITSSWQPFNTLTMHIKWASHNIKFNLMLFLSELRYAYRKKYIFNNFVGGSQSKSKRLKIAFLICYARYPYVN